MYTRVHKFYILAFYANKFLKIISCIIIAFKKKRIISKEILHEDFYNFSPIRKTDYTINP